MVKPKLFYFPIKGRAFAIRLALAIGDIEYEFIPMSGESLKARREEFPFGQLPAMEIEGAKLCQSAACLEWAAEKAGLLPKDHWGRVKILEVLCCMDDVIAKVGPSLYEKDQDTKLRMRAALMDDDKLPKMFANLEKIVHKSSAAPGCAVGGAMSSADLVVFQVLDWFHSGSLDGIPKEIVNEKAHPTLIKIQETVGAHPKVKAYLATIA
eukprot:Selendium_serpulae@DN3623_c0_g1_i1.p1